MKTRRVNVRGIIFKDGKLLVTKFRQEDDSESAHWGTFGGGLDVGEPLVSGLHREMIEETSVAPKIGKLLFIQQFSEGEKEYLEFFFHVENADNYTAIDFSTTSHGELELVRHEFLDPKTHHVLPAFLQTIDIADYIANDKPIYIYNELDT